MASEKPGVVQGVAEAAAAIVEAVPVYQDAIQPVAQEAGKAIATPLFLLNTALRPVKSIMLAVNLTFDRLDGELKRILAGVPKEKIVEPPTNIAGPLLLAYPFAETEPRLREMFARLLATAMNIDTQGTAHPSFVEVIRQLAPEEAGLMSELVRRGARHPVPAGRLDTMDTTGSHSTVLVISALKTVTGVHFPVCAGNLQRLGLINIVFDEWLVAPDAYIELEKREEYTSVKAAIEARGLRFEMTRGILRVTAYGQRFVEACIALPTDASAWQKNEPK